MSTVAIPDISLFSGDKNRDIRTVMENAYARDISFNQSFWVEADIDTRCRAGDQNIFATLFPQFAAPRKTILTLNRINTMCNMVAGHQRRNRKSSQVIGIENSDEETASQFTEILLWAMNKEGVLETLSEAFDGAITSGRNLLHVWLDYREDPLSGNIKVNNLPYNSYLIDPFFKKHDLSDCRYIWTRKWMSREEIASLLPTHKKEIYDLQTGRLDGKFEFLPEAFNVPLDNLLTYDEYWYKDSREQIIIVDTKSGETTEWKGSDENLKKFLKAFPDLSTIRTKKQTTRLAILVQNTVFYDGPNPMGIDRMPFVPVLGYFYPELTEFASRSQGIVRSLRSAQFLYNHRKTVELDIVESQINSGFKYKPDSLINPEDIFLTGQGRGLAFKKNASLEDAQKIVSPGVDPTIIELSKLLSQDLPFISGINEELLGAADDSKAGILAMLRQGAGLTTLQKLFDQLDYSQKLMSELFIDIIQENFKVGKVKKITRKMPTPQFYSRAFGKYGCQVVDGVNTSSQKQMQLAQMIELKELGVDIPSSMILEASNLQNKKEIIEKIESQEAQKSQMEQLQMQQQMRERAAISADLESRAEANRGLGLERASRVEENRALAVERLAEAEESRKKGALDIAKTIKELEGIDIEQIEKLLRIADFLKNKESMQEKEEERRSKIPNIEELSVLQTKGESL